MHGSTTIVHLILLDRDGRSKALVGDPRRSLGFQLGGGVRLGLIGDVLAVGEGIETMLSLRSALPRMPVLAGLSATHLAALELPDCIRRLYVARDKDPEGRRAETRLRVRLRGRAIEVRSLSPAYGDLNVDLQRLGCEVLRRRIARQLAPEDRERFAPEADDGRRARRDRCPVCSTCGGQDVERVLFAAGHGSHHGLLEGRSGRRRRAARAALSAAATASVAYFPPPSALHREAK